MHEYWSVDGFLLHIRRVLSTEPLSSNPGVSGTNLTAFTVSVWPLSSDHTPLEFGL